MLVSRKVIALIIYHQLCFYVSFYPNNAASCNQEKNKHQKCPKMSSQRHCLPNVVKIRIRKLKTINIKTKKKKRKPRKPNECILTHGCFCYRGQSPHYTVLMHIEAVHRIRRSTMSTYGAQKAAGRLIVCLNDKKSKKKNMQDVSRKLVFPLTRARCWTSSTAAWTTCGEPPTA